MLTQFKSGQANLSQCLFVSLSVFGVVVVVVVVAAAAVDNIAPQPIIFNGSPLPLALCHTCCFVSLIIIIVVVVLLIKLVVVVSGDGAIVIVMRLACFGQLWRALIGVER